ncbi:MULTISPECIES: response regulator [Bacillaceae]|uniref:response regulator transcription factor n=1 Tax=Bacillaceae TaxID=186817 RepID=UPI001E63C941|nr:MULTISPECIES: response regulator [Bacillaceae]MCE4051379.1 response regulator [Bacillus sp. Au-Bac7]MCM3029280.1 response regulator [Niallia sp. MER 6]MDL0436458.1 response regulator [Niallia sp. SS-2023]UPO88648.1 response regulator [Niallia sp. Man26]
MYTKTILIVDDEPMARQGIKRTLDAWATEEWQILAASNGIEAIELVKKHKIHILITDIRMPQITGIKLLQEIKVQNLTPVAIVISAYSEFEYAQEALRLGVINYLLKPVSKKKLIDAVEDAIQRETKQTRAEIMEKVMDEKLLKINMKENTAKEPVREAVRYIDKNLKTELSLKLVAEHVHLNPSYLSVLFKEQMKVTFSEYITRRRIEHAKEILIATNQPITDIAEECGYKTSKYFIKIFRELEGVTPSMYRRTNSVRAF